MKTGFIILCFGLFFYGSVQGFLWLDNHRCAVRWSESGLKAKTNYGCNVEIAPGKWVPESSVQIKPETK